MRGLFCFLVVGLCLSIIGRLIMLARGEFPERTATQEAWNVATGVALLIWILMVWP